MALELIPTSKRQLGSDIPEGITGQPSTGCLRAMIPSTRLKMIERSLLLVSRTMQSHSSSWAQIGPWDVQIKVAGPMRMGWCIRPPGQVSRPNRPRALARTIALWFVPDYREWIKDNLSGVSDSSGSPTVGYWTDETAINTFSKKVPRQAVTFNCHHNLMVREPSPRM